MEIEITQIIEAYPRIAISKIIRVIFNVKILLNFLLEFNLSKMNNIKSKDTNINQMFFRLNKELKNYNFKELFKVLFFIAKKR